MSNRLDQRIRKLVVEVVDTSPPPPAFADLQTPTPRRRPTRRIVAVAVAALTVVTLAFGAAWFVRDDRSASVDPARSSSSRMIRLPLDAIPEGVTTRILDRVPVFVVRQGDRVTALLLPVGGALWWCPRERVFSSPLDGGIFDVDGNVIDGTALYGLDRLSNALRGRFVDVDPTRVLPSDGSSRQTFTTGTTAFCENPLRSPSSRVTSVRVAAFPNLKYEAERYTAPAGMVDIRLISRGGSHTLVFRHSRLKGFELKTSGGPTRRIVNLAPGRYEIFCSIPGHRAAGERATIVVRPKYAPSGDQS